MSVGRDRGGYPTFSLQRRLDEVEVIARALWLLACRPLPLQFFGRDPGRLPGSRINQVPRGQSGT